MVKIIEYGIQLLTYLELRENIRTSGELLIFHF